jgi:hypothetical protein
MAASPFRILWRGRGVSTGDRLAVSSTARRLILPAHPTKLPPQPRKTVPNPPPPPPPSPAARHFRAGTRSGGSAVLQSDKHILAWSRKWRPGDAPFAVSRW